MMVPTEPILADAALKLGVLLIAGTFVAVLGVLLKLTAMETLLSHPQSGLVHLFAELRKDFDALRRRVDIALGSSE